jgi:peptide/nickel transport system ATP-binding protein
MFEHGAFHYSKWGARFQLSPPGSGYNVMMPQAQVDNPHPVDPTKDGIPLLELRNIEKLFANKLGLLENLGALVGRQPVIQGVRAVSQVSLSIAAGEVLGLVGESGCGKSTLGRIAVGLIEATAGQRLWKGQDLADQAVSLSRKEQLAIQMIFQDPYSSLNPRMRVEQIVGEAPVVHGLVESSGRKAYVAEILARVGLDPVMSQRYPHQFSGGQRARVGIARALATQPAFVVCDESVAALDVSIQAQVLNLYMDLRDQLGLTYLFISHDLGVVKHISDRVAVMYLGRIVELAKADEIYAKPIHPYTQALLAQAPRLDERKRSYDTLKGELPSPMNPPSGCHFHPRCPHATERCSAEIPPLREIAPGHTAACHLTSA